MPNFRSILPAELSGNAIQRISKQWALASAQKPDGAVNTMTISWGGLGYLWNQPVAFLFVRPQRYTYEFVESADGFSLCFFPEKYRKELQYCGTISGRDEDKIAHCGFTVAHQDGVPYFEEAEAVLILSLIHIFKGRKKFKVHNALVVGDWVVLARMQKGKKCVVLDRIKANPALKGEWL